MAGAETVAAWRLSRKPTRPVQHKNGEPKHGEGKIDAGSVRSNRLGSFDDRPARASNRRRCWMRLSFLEALARRRREGNLVRLKLLTFLYQLTGYTVEQVETLSEERLKQSA